MMKEKKSGVGRVEVKRVLDLMSGGNFVRRLAIEQMMYMSMVGEGDGMYHVFVGDDSRSYVQEFIRLMVNVSGKEGVRYINHDELFEGKYGLSDSVKLVVGSGTVAKKMSGEADVVLKYLVDGEPMYIEPIHMRAEGRTLRFGGVVVQKLAASELDEFIDSMSEGLKRRVSVLEFADVEDKERLDGDEEFIDALKAYLLSRYG